uniref:DUF4789 domain-containing protein n=1 Tax=Anopheles dirus TaxID=7168 RepID=A0A182NRT6_9DIPT
MSSFIVTSCAAFAAVLVLLPYGGQTAGQELFAFPADVVVSAYLENARNRTPVFIPGKCSTNEILYPGDHDNDWVCDCRPGYVYSPQEDTCYPLFERGFCQQGEYVDLARPSMIVKCTKNVCTKKGDVPYKDQCVQLHRNNFLCPKQGNVRLVIGVNVNTLQLDCVQGMLEISYTNRNTNDDEEPAEGTPKPMETTTVIFYPQGKYCNNGTKAMHDGKCH